MAEKYLDDTGLSHFWGKIKGKTIPYGYCETGTSTVAKTVTVSPAITSLEEGLVISVKFKNSNTASNPTLNVNSLGAKRIYRYGTTAPSSSAASSWNAGNAFTFIYDGSAWQMAGWMNTTYSSMTVAEYEAGTGTTARTITPARLKGAIQHWATGEANVQSDWEQTDDTADDFIKNKPTIPDVSNKVSKTGDTMTGSLEISNHNKLILDGNEVSPYGIPKVGLLVNSGFEVVGSVHTPSLSFTNETDGDGTVYVRNIHRPANDNDAANKKYVDDNKFSGSYNDLTNKPTIPTKTSDLTNDSGFITSYTETDPIFTQSPAYGITEQDIADWNSKPSLITLLETGKKAFVLNVSGTTATLIDYSGGGLATFSVFFNYYTIVQDCYIGQVINGAIDINQAQVRVYEAAEIDISTASIRLISVDNGVIYTADLQDTGNGLVGTLSSQTIPTGGITTETDPTVPAWAKASTKPSYGASEISASFPQSHYIDSATNVGGALDTLAYELYGVDQTANAALPKSGGQLTGDLTLYVASGNSPAIIFQRGTLTDNYNDWKIYDKGGYLYFAQRGSGSSSFNDMGYIDTTGVLRSFTIPWGSVTGKPTIPTKTSDLTNDSGFLTQHQDISGKVDRFKVTLSYNSSTQEYSVDKTYAEIESAVSANKYVYISDTTETVSSTLGQAHFVIVAPLTLASPQDYWYEFRTVISGANGETTEVFYSLADDGVYVNTGKILINTGLPPVSSSDNGKILRVVSGAWSVVSLPSASGVSF